jgi:hypothetical protein
MFRKRKHSFISIAGFDEIMLVDWHHGVIAFIDVANESLVLIQ